MGVREWLNNNPGAAVGSVTALLLVALVVLFWSWGGSSQRAAAYYWDLEDGVVFTARPGQEPPIEAPSGGPGVRAQLYTCGECTPAEWFGVLETRPDASLGLAEADEEAGRLIRALRGGEVRGSGWVAFDSPEGEAILSSVYEQCEQPRECHP